MIHVRSVLRLVGLLTLVLSGSMLLTTLAILAWFGMQPTELAAKKALLVTVAAGVVIGLALWLVGYGRKAYLGRREALLLVAISWLIGAALAGMPYRMWALFASADDHQFSSMVSCYFEAMSGLTTTGATVLGDVSALPRALLLWRATTHWLGGLGIVVLFVAVLPTLGVGGKRLFQIEAPGPASQGVRPRIRETARMLWLIYLVLTVAQVMLLWSAGMNIFDAVCHTFATMATGGFSTAGASVGAFDSIAIDTIVIVFMLLAGVNFGVYYLVLRGKARAAWRDPELRLYLLILLVATLIVAWDIHGRPVVLMTGGTGEAAGVGEAIRYGAFQVVAVQTTTGFCTADFDRWGVLSRGVLVVLMFVGASAGSTGGGIKVIRCFIALKVLLAEFERVFRPNVVRTVNVGRWSVDPELKLTTLAYVLGVGALFAIGTFVLMMIEPGLDLTSAATASAATLNNVGPGLGDVGAVKNYGWFSGPSKILLSLLMALGRLEIFAILVLLMPSFWRGE
ncbi:MAG: potassium transporter [Phycisphaeraceae bacterium]|nr:potassium transporter [Phycisphaeraceae bacterium]